ncbi:hypothetical protein CIK06_27640 [Plantactinospora sp. KBS50]|nr:hypothetical protein CIK06_27640 [Plantactinospora sp. KBS50]
MFRAQRGQRVVTGETQPLVDLAADALQITQNRVGIRPRPGQHVEQQLLLVRAQLVEVRRPRVIGRLDISGRIRAVILLLLLLLLSVRVPILIGVGVPVTIVVGGRIGVRVRVGGPAVG